LYIVECSQISTKGYPPKRINAGIAWFEPAFVTGMGIDTLNEGTAVFGKSRVREGFRHDEPLPACIVTG
jgi:hypothetical protein